MKPRDCRQFDLKTTDENRHTKEDRLTEHDRRQHSLLVVLGARFPTGNQLISALNTGNSLDVFGCVYTVCTLKVVHRHDEESITQISSNDMEMNDLPLHHRCSAVCASASACACVRARVRVFSAES